VTGTAVPIISSKTCTLPVSSSLASVPAKSANGPETIRTRCPRTRLAPFGALVYEPVNDIYVHPNDIIYLYRDPQTFLAFGAVGSQRQIPFDNWRITAAEALAKAGGLADALADPAAVFLDRGETRDVAAALGIDCTTFEGPIIPVIYNFDLRNPATHFLMTSFEMRNKDVIYTSNAVSVEQTKFMTYINTVNATVNSPISTAINVYALKNIAHGTQGTAIFTTAPTINVPATAGR
jgi:polysaccharide biosynthesis/export protein